ncbi:DoxX family protein [Nonomuraea recticatena]|uniref:DoxX family protein n=1 Tax=Nonomuraea recticatena TaxID=46178 RepID=UPI0031F84B42
MKRVLFDLAALVTRVAIGLVFVSHGWQKWQTGIDSVTQMFTKMGVPQPGLAAGFTMTAELVGGALLIIGLFVPVAALALVAAMAGAFLFVHAPNGVFVGDGGWELVGALGAACLVLAAVGGGRFGVDGIRKAALARRAQRRAEANAAARAPIDVDGVSHHRELSSP